MTFYSSVQKADLCFSKDMVIYNRFIIHIRISILIVFLLYLLNFFPLIA